MLNESQHRIMALPQVQELMKALGCEPHDPGYTQRQDISRRVDQWHRGTAEAQPRVLSTDAPVDKTDGAIKSWLQQQHRIFGQNWCPFCLALIVALVMQSCGHTPVRQHVVHPPVEARMGKSIPVTRGPRNNVSPFESIYAYTDVLELIN